MVSFIGTCPMAFSLPQSFNMALQEGNERMRKEIVNNDGAVTHVIEFTIAITVFVLIFQAFTSSMHYRIGIDLDNEDNYVVMAREVISELTGSEGLVGNQTDWETLEFGTGNPNLAIWAKFAPLPPRISLLLILPFDPWLLNLKINFF